MSASVQVFYYTGPYTSTLLPAADALLARLNPVRRARFEQRIGEQRALDLAALRVLELGMQACGYPDFKLADIAYPLEAGISGKPRWLAGPADFSISHANGIAACAIATNCRVGLDAEDVRAIDPKAARRLVADSASIARDLNVGNALARWTQIEAVLKAAGLGVMHGREIEWRDSEIHLRGQQWWIHEVDCGNGHVVHVAVDAPTARVAVTAIAPL